MEYQDENRERRITQLRKGILELAVMGALYNQTHYGYSLVRVLCENGSIDLKEGTIYPILGRLSRDGLVASQWVESDQGPPRKYYQLTPSGRRMFDDLREEFQVLVSLVKQSASNDSQTRPGKKLVIARS